MKQLLQKPGEQKCLTYCTAMLLDLPIEIVENMIGHDGMEVLWPERSGNERYRGVHIQEIQDVFISYGKAIFPIEKFPYLAPIDDTRFAKAVFDSERSVMRFYARLIGHTGILIYRSHAKVLDVYGSIYDPSNKEILQITPRQVSSCREAWLLGEIKSN